MSEVKSTHLQDICKITGIRQDSARSDIETLQLILDSLEANKKDSGDSSSVKLDSSKISQIADSLAFPSAHRLDKNLKDRSELWNQLDKLNKTLKADYSARRQMVLERLDRTVDSFKSKWANADRHKTDQKGSTHKTRSDLIEEKYKQARADLTREPNVTLSHLLAVRETDCDKYLNNVVSSRSVDCKVNYPKQAGNKSGQEELVNLKQIIIPKVPDRGGRTGDKKDSSSNKHFRRRY